MIINAAKVALRASRKARLKEHEIPRLLKKKWKRASPLTKAGIVAAAVVPKAAFVGAGYFMSRQDEKE
tara:strand:+ start:958 stop:1161 length:204 start_codon:yes stop_codon:yes gene_type:complete